MSNTIYALYNDDHVVYEGAKKLVKKGVKIKDVFKILNYKKWDNRICLVCKEK